MGKVLILSDNVDSTAQIKEHIASMRHSSIAAVFDDAAKVISMRNPDLVLVDLVIAGGIVEVWRQIKYDIEENHVPAVVMIAVDRVREIELLEGMDDFVIYPYDIRELEMRINMIIRQREGADSGDFIKIANLIINTTKYEVTVDGWPVVLTLKEYELLKYLATRPGRVLTREVLLDQVWGYDYYGGTRTVDVHIGRVRTKIETGKYSFIKTVRGVGYTFTDEYFAD